MTDLPINWGSDLDTGITLLRPDGGPLDLTGCVVDVIRPHPSLVGRINLAVTNAAAGRVNIRIEWDDAMLMGRFMTFRLRVSLGQHNTTTTPYYVVVS